MWNNHVDSKELMIVAEELEDAIQKITAMQEARKQQAHHHHNNSNNNNNNNNTAALMDHTGRWRERESF
jgi:hypothetical protein